MSWFLERIDDKRAHPRQTRMTKHQNDRSKADGSCRVEMNAERNVPSSPIKWVTGIHSGNEPSSP